ncbi:MAG TPA: hypothetical protein VNX68_15040, partial [Nitrosopumilaceae archaeon]|nr:hypothetical protein [Nitrosopumilaceae archaeon]
GRSGEPPELPPRVGRFYDQGRVPQNRLLGTGELPTIDVNPSEPTAPVRPQLNPALTGDVSDWEPQEMRVRGIRGKSGLENIAVGGADPAVLDALSESLYTRNPEVIGIKELIQNASDEHKISGSKDPIRAATVYEDKNPITKEQGHSIIVQDSGRGMTPAQLYSEFTDVGKTGKANVESASGGFGFAKASPLLGGDYAQITSIVKEGDDVVKYSFSGTPTEFKNQAQGVSLDKEYMPDDTPTGTRVRVYYPKTANISSVDRMIKSMGENSFDSPIIHSKEFYSSSSPKEIEQFLNNKDAGAVIHKPLQKPPLVDTIDSPNAKIDIHFNQGDENESQSSYNLHIQNKGLWQQELNNNYGTVYGVKGAPKDIYVNVASKIEEGKKGYPFGLNREQLQQDPTYKSILDWINKNIVAGTLEKQKAQLQRLYDAMPESGIKDTNRPSVFFDSGDRLTKPEKAKFINSPIVQEIARTMDDTIEDILRSVGNKSWSDRLEKTGTFLSGTKEHGLHVPDPKSKGGSSTILTNLFSHASTTDDPKITAEKTVITWLHEVGHIGDEEGHTTGRSSDAHMAHPGYGDYIGGYLNQIQEQGGGNPGHEVHWIQRLGDIYAKFGPEPYERAIDRLYKAIADPRTGGYSPEFQELLQTYQESRGRPATTEDFLSRTGVKHESPKKGEGDSSSINKSDGEGANSPDEPIRKQPAPEVNRERTRRIATEAITKLTDAIRSAKPIREDQEAVYSQEKSNRIQAAMKFKGQGESGFYKQLGELKGAYPKLSFQSIRNELNQKEVNALFNMITDSSRISPFEKISAQTGLAKLLGGYGGVVPQRSELKLLSEVFGPKLGDVIEMHGGLGLVGGKYIKEVVNIPKSLMSSVDYSAPLRQGLPLIYTKQFWTSFKDMFKQFNSEKAFQAVQDSIMDRPGYLIGRKAGLKLTNDRLDEREEAFMSHFVEKAFDVPKLIPGIGKYIPNPIRASERAYVGFLNKLRADVFDDLVSKARNMSKDGRLDRAQLVSIAKFVNVSTGRGGMGKLDRVAPELNTVFFSPRLIASRLTMLNPNYYVKLDPRVRLEALKALLSVAGAGLVTGALGYALGGEISGNPVNADFGKVKFGQTRMDPYAGFQQYIVAASRLITGKEQSSTSGKTWDLNNPGWRGTTRKDVVENFTRAKLSPVMGLGWDMLKGTDFQGQPLNISKEVGNVFMPMYLGDMIDLYKSNPELLPLGLPAAFGMGMQTYQQPVKKSLRFTGMGSMGTIK